MDGIQIVVTCDPQGGLNIRWPKGKVPLPMILGLLQMAGTALIDEAKDMAAEQKIQPARADLLDRLRNGT